MSSSPSSTPANSINSAVENSSQHAVDAGNASVGGGGGGGGPAERGEDFVEREAKLEALFADKRASHGTLNHPEVLHVAFALFDQLIALYRLERLDALLEEVMPIVEKIKAEDQFKFYPRAIQMKAFLRFKQRRFEESLQLFTEFRKLEGDSVQLLENMGHAQNALGKFQEAELLFKAALALTTRQGGLLLGLGASAARRGDYAAALDFQRRAMESWQAEYGTLDHSLCAKAMTGMAASLRNLGRLEDAEKVLRDAVRIFTVTCTYESPLTANAMSQLGRVLQMQKKNDEQFLFKALELFTLHHDTLDTLALAEVMQGVMLLIKSPQNAQPYVRLFNGSLGKVLKTEMDDNLAVYCKYAGELSFLAQAYPTAAAFLTLARDHFKSVTHLDTSGLVQTCTILLSMLEQKFQMTGK